MDSIAVLTTDKTVDDKKINAELSSIWRLVQQDAKLRQQIEKEGIDLKHIADNPYVAKVEEGQIGVAETIIIAAGAQLAKEIAKTLWEKVVWPRLSRRFGASLSQQEGKAKR